MRGKIKNILGQILIYPSMGGNLNLDSYITHSNAPLLTIQNIKEGRENYYGKEFLSFAEVQKTLPLFDKDFSNLPATVIFVAEFDPLSSEGILYDKILRDNGQKSFCYIEKGLVHSYIRARNRSKKARDSFKRILMATNNIAKNIWHY